MNVSLSQLKNFSRRFLNHQSENRKKVFANSAWLFSEKILRMGLSFLVSAWVIRSLGPVDFGLLSYALAFMAFFEPLANLGLPAIVKKQLVVDQGKQETYLGTVWGLLLAAGTICFLAMNTLALILHPQDLQMQLLILLSSLTFFARPFDVIEMHFDSQIKSRPMVLVKLISMLLSSLLKVLCIILHLNLYFFISTFVLELFFMAFGYLVSYQKFTRSLRHWKFDRKLGLGLLKKSWPIIFSGLTIVIYMKIDQVMLKHYLGSGAVGIYSAAVKLSEMWYFIPMTLSVSFFPVIMEAHHRSFPEFEQKMQKIFTAMTWLFLFLGLPFIVLSPQIILLLFSAKYQQAVPILQVHFWTGIFVFWGVAQGIWDMALNTVRYSSIRTMVGALFNVGLNMWLIPRFGGMGAAVATLCAQAITNTVMNVFHPRTRQIFYYQWRSFDPRTLGLFKVKS